MDAALALRESLRGTRCAACHPTTLVRLQATTCDFVWLSAPDGARTLLKLVADDGVAAAGKPLLHVGDDSLSELCCSVGDVVRALTVRAGAVRPWSELLLAPADGATAKSLPSSAAVLEALSHGRPCVRHAWRCDCRCDRPLLPQRGHCLRLRLATRAEPLECAFRCEAVAGAATAAAAWLVDGKAAQTLPSTVTQQLALWGYVGASTRVRFVESPVLLSTPATEAAANAADAIGRLSLGDRESGGGEAEVSSAQLLRTLLTAFQKKSVGGGSCESVATEACSSALLCGPSGAGKSEAARAACTALQLPLLRLTPAQLRDMLSGGSDGGSGGGARALLLHARRCAPSVLFLDDVDAVASPRAADTEGVSGGGGEALPLLCALLELVRAALTGGRSGCIFVLAACASPSLLHPALLSQLRVTVRLSLPPPLLRTEILRATATQQVLLPPAPRLARALASRMHGFSAADVGAVCEEARLAVLGRGGASEEEGGEEGEGKGEGSTRERLVGRPEALAEPSEEEWWDAVRSVQPSGLLGLLGEGSRGGASATAQAPDAQTGGSIEPQPFATTAAIHAAPPILAPPAGGDADGGGGRDGWGAVGGLGGVKRRLQLLVQAPLEAPSLCGRLGLGAGPRGVLLYGPPGTGKTLLVRTLAAEARLNLIAVAIPQLIKPEVGASERALASLFERARAHAPCLLFLDELQALFGRRGAVGRVGRQLLSQLLLELDALQADGQGFGSCSGSGGSGSSATVTLIGATNMPDALDEALLRPGRFEFSLYIGPPRRAARHAILARQLSHMPLVGHGADELANDLAARTPRFSGADLVALCQRAAMLALQRSGAEGRVAGATTTSIQLDRDDFHAALREVAPSLSHEMLLRLRAWARSRSSVDVDDRLNEPPLQRGAC